MNLFDLVAKLTLDDKDFKQSASDAEKTGSNLGSKLASALGTGAKVAGAGVAAVAGGIAAASKAMVSAAGETAAYGDNIDKMSQKLGISAQAYQEWDFIMQHSGTSIEGMSKGMMTLTKAAEEGDKAFLKLGLSAGEVKNMNQEELFAAVIEGLQGMEDASERTVLAQKLLGGAAKELGPLLNTSAEETAAMREQVHELGGVMSDEAVKAAAGYQDSLQNMQTALGSIKTKMISEFLPGITSVMDGLTALFSGDSRGLGTIKMGITGIVNTITGELPKIVQIGTSIVTSLLEAITQNLPQIMSAGVDMVMQLTQGVLDNLPEILSAGIEAVLALVDGIADALPELIPAAIGAVLQLVETLTEPSTLEHLIQAALELMVALALGLVKAIPQLIREAPVIISHVVQALVAEIPQLIGAALELMIALASGLIEAIPELLVAAGEVLLALAAGFINGVHDFIDVGRQFVEGLWEGIKGAWDWVVNQVTSLFSGLVGSVKRVLGIRSPSKVMREQVGQQVGKGVALGILDCEDDVKEAAKKLADASTGQLVYEANKDYAALMMQAKDYEEFLKYAALRNAKIAGENINIADQHWKSTNQILEDWKAATGALAYEVETDYAAMILKAETWEEAQHYAALRNSKIIAENIDLTAHGWQTTESLLDQWQKSVDETTNAVSKKAIEVTNELREAVAAVSKDLEYSAETDYAAIMMKAKTLEEFVAAAQARNAKIIGENIDLLENGWKTSEEILDDWLALNEDVNTEATKKVLKTAENVKAAAEQVLEIVLEQMDIVQNYINKLPDNFRAVGENMMKSMADGVIRGTSRLIGAVRDAVSKAVAEASLVAGVSSDSFSTMPSASTSTISSPVYSTQPVTIEFTGDLAQLGRVLQPVIKEEEGRVGTNLVMA